MGRFTLDELKAAFADYDACRIRCSETGDWSQYADLFTEDAVYIEHAYGELHGRQAIEEWIVGVMAPFPTMTFPQDWWVLDEERDAIVFCCQNTFPEPFRADGTPYAFPNWTRLVYGGDGKWKSEEDIYNPRRDAPGVFKDWVKAGGKLESDEQVKMVHR